MRRWSSWRKRQGLRSRLRCAYKLCSFSPFRYVVGLVDCPYVPTATTACRVCWTVEPRWHLPSNYCMKGSYRFRSDSTTYIHNNHMSFLLCSFRLVVAIVQKSCGCVSLSVCEREDLSFFVSGNNLRLSRLTLGGSVLDTTGLLGVLSMSKPGNSRRKNINLDLVFELHGVQ